MEWINRYQCTKCRTHDDVIEWKYFPRYWPGEFPSQRPVKRSFDVSFDLHPNKWLSQQSWGWWFETASRPLWRNCNAPSNLKYKTHISFVDHSDVVGLLQLHVHSRLNAWLQWIWQSNFKTRHEAFKFCDLLRLIPKVGWQIYGPLLKRKHERSISRDLFIWMSHGMFCIQTRS